MPQMRGWQAFQKLSEAKWLLCPVWRKLQTISRWWRTCLANYLADWAYYGAIAGLSGTEWRHALLGRGCSDVQHDNGFGFRASAKLQGRFYRRAMADIKKTNRKELMSTAIWSQAD